MNSTYEMAAMVLAGSTLSDNIIQTKKNDSFHGIDLYGTALITQKSTSACTKFQFENETGTGEITCYSVFAGIELFYNDMHTAYCNQKQSTAKNIIEINHCREGRYECSFGENSCCYMAQGDLAIGSLTRKKSYSSFPLNHYHGITVVINLDEIIPEILSIMEMLGIDLEKIHTYICKENRCCIMRANPSVEHIFSEMYHVREKRKAGYMKVKILELLLFLSDLDAEEEVVQTDYYSSSQVKLIKEIAAFITTDLTSHFTIEQLAQRFHISPTALKRCFRGVYGSSIYAYLRTYRLQVAERMLKESVLSITEIAAKIGYENPNKFTSAFKSVYGIPPTALRKSVQMDRN